MSTLKVYSASAGSGKTFSVAREYLTLALNPRKPPTEYRRILAVTFTNKAVEEMKQRILLQLAQTAAGKECDYFCSALGIPAAEVQARAALVQRTILHNYSAFAVMTIDKFFQKVLQAFVREAGLHPKFDIELDTQRLTEEAVDITLENAAQDTHRRQWLRQFVERQIENSHSWNIRRALETLGQELFSERYQQLYKGLRQRLHDREFLAAYYDRRTAELTQIDARMRAIARQAKEFMRANNYTAQDFRFKESGFINYFSKISAGIYDIGVRTAEAVDNIAKWTAGSSPKDITPAYAALNPLLKEACGLWQEGARAYNTSKLICKNFMQMGLLADIAQEVRRLSIEANTLPLTETIGLISGLIGASDTPFLYEKMGSAYHHIIIDEFQDTSQGQWRNFVPLVAGSLSAGGAAMVVGDIKQSIYRWRSGDWRILGGIAQSSDIGRFGKPEMHALSHNWRSGSNIVRFNNAVIEQTKDILQNILQKTLPDGIPAEVQGKCLEMLSASYADTAQTPTAKDGTGFARVEFVYKKDETPPRDAILAKLPALVLSLMGRGYAPSDIALLARSKKDAALIMDTLLAAGQDGGFNVISQDTLQLNSSLLVRLCIALMRTAAGQDSPLNEAFAKYALHALVKWQPRTPMHQIFADPFDETERAFLRSLALCSLPEAFEKMVQRYNLHLCQSDLPFLQALFDLVIGFSNKKISDMGAFLQWWERQGGAAAALAGGGGQNAVVVDTIHKSKGLEYRAVIVPFADWELNPKANSIVWMHCPAPPYNEIEQLPLSCSAAMGSSFFAEQYAEEKTLSFLDNLNLLYVALTRARDELYVYVPAGAGRAAGRISDALQMAFANFDPARFAPARLTLAEEGVFEFGSPAPCAAAPAPVPQSAPVVWNAYFSRGPVPALRVRRGEGQGGFVPL